MAEHHSTSTTAGHHHDYLPAAGHDSFLPFYDLFTKALGARKLHRALIDQAELAPGQRVLEIGCGTGNLTLAAKRRQPGIEVIGSDPDPLALARARRKARNLPGVRFEEGYAQRLPYADAAFDRVLSALMLHHMDEEAKVAAAGEVRRVLRPGGRLHLVDITAHAHGSLVSRIFKRGHLANNAGGAIPALFRAAGLECVEVDTQRLSIFGDVTYYRITRVD